jgi:hypothetical protein
MTMARTTFTTDAAAGRHSWRLPVDHPTADEATHERTTEMTTPETQTQPASPHLTAARELLDEVASVTAGPDGDAQAKATAAAAHATLVLAEQVAAARLTLARTALLQHQQPEVKG